MPTVEGYAQGTPCYVELVTPDPAAAAGFYHSLLGWEVAEADPADAAGHRTASVGGAVVAGLTRTPSARERAASWRVHLAVDRLPDAGDVAAWVGAAGGTVEAGPGPEGRWARVARVRDPSGAEVGLWQAGELAGSVRVNEPGCPVWHELTTPDLPTATRFYRDLLGVEWAALPMETGDDYTCLVVGGRPVAGALPPQVAGSPPRWDVYFCVADCDATLAHAVGLGGVEAVPAYDLPGVGRTATVRDPQGASVGLLQDLPEEQD